MNSQPIKAEIICQAYKNGRTLTEIGKALNLDSQTIEGYLKRYFEYFYNEPYKPYSEKRAEFLEELYQRYDAVYSQGLFNRKQLCEILGCNVLQLEAMFKKYNIHNQWLKTYYHQKTLCNVSEEFYNSVKDFAKEYGYKSVREVSVRAINEFMLQQMIYGNKEKVVEPENLVEYKEKKEKLLIDRVERSRQYYKKQYWKNPEKARERKRKSYWKNVEKSRDYAKLKRERKKQILLDERKEG